MIYNENMTSPGTSLNSSFFPSHSPFVAPSILQAQSTSMGLNNDIYVSNNHFTFSSPTQCPIITSSQQYTALSSQTISMHRMSAPGMGVSWQHTVPTHMPWSESSSTIQFTSITSAPRLLFRSSTSSSASCSTSSSQRPKRHNTSCTIDQDSPPNKQFISEERISAHMQNLYIGSSPSKFSANDKPCIQDHGWDKFLLLEETLTNEDMEEKTAKLNSFKIADDIKDSIFTPAHILPPQILEKLVKPSLEVVLWKSPEGVVEEIINKVKVKEQADDNLDVISLDSGRQIQALINNNMPTDLNSNICNDMEVDFFDGIDDEMTL